MKKKFYIGIDIGGTKISAGLVDRKGKIYQREKISTPHNISIRETVKILVNIINELVECENIKLKSISGVGIGFPGIIHPKKATILAAPNMSLHGTNLAQELQSKLHLPIHIDNDVNVGTLGEYRFGSAKGFHNIVGLFPGTGVGGGIILNGRIFSGTNGAAAEVGHMIVDRNGPKCNCGNNGCLEALTGRWAIERDIKAAIKGGEKSIITSLADTHLNQIKSKTLRKALDKKDPLMTRIMRNVSMHLGTACISIRHLIDPEIIVLGGGVIEACGDFMMPIIQKTCASDKFLSHVPKCKIVKSKLADDAVILGATALFHA